MSLNETTSGERLHIAFFGRRNAGKSSLVNALTGQRLSVVSDVPGTTTDPVKKAMELLPLGPVMIWDTAGFDDEGGLGELRVEKTREVLAKTDIAVLVTDAAETALHPDEAAFLAELQKRATPYIHVKNKADLTETAKDDGVLYMMLRSNTEWLWCSDSSDDGLTWSEPYATEYSDGVSKFHFGRLPDGRFYGVSNAYPDFLYGDCRKTLYICVSEDGENFNSRYIIRDEPYAKRFEGRNKDGQYGYPHTLIHEGYMYVIYSKRKENVEVTRFSLEQLQE